MVCDVKRTHTIRRYMYSSVADLMAVGSWQLIPVSQSPACPFQAIRPGWPLLCMHRVNIVCSFRQTMKWWLLWQLREGGVAMKY